MSDSKNLLTFVVSASLAALIAVCLGLFWLTWTSLEETERMREENHQLLLGNTVCKLRLDNLQGGRPSAPALSEEALEAAVKAQAQADLTPPPAPAPAPAAAAKAPAPKAPAPEKAAVQPVPQAPAQPQAAEVKTEPPAKPAESARSEVVLMPSAGTVQTASAEAEPPAAAASAPIAETAPDAKPVLKNPWFVQLGAYARESQAKDFALDAEDILAEAGLPAKAFVVKRKTRWLVCLDEPLTRPKALQAAEKVQAAGVDAVIIRLPKAK